MIKKILRWGASPIAIPRSVLVLVVLFTTVNTIGAAARLLVEEPVPIIRECVIEENGDKREYL